MLINSPRFDFLSELTINWNAEKRFSFALHKNIFNGGNKKSADETTVVGSYIDDALGGVLDVYADGEVEEVVHWVPSGAKLVDGLLPGEGALVPGVSVQNRPAAKSPQHVQERLDASSFNSGCKNIFN